MTLDAFLTACETTTATFSIVDPDNTAAFYKMNAGTTEVLDSTFAARTVESYKVAYTNNAILITVTLASAE